MTPAQALYPLFARLHGSSDIEVFNQIFLFDEYACLRSIPAVRWILDLGANAGYSSAWFLTCFPAARVIAVEPDPDNCDLCRRNLAPYGQRARLVSGAAWSTRSRLLLRRGAFADGREWATQVCAAANGAGDVEGYDLPGLLQMTGGEPIDLLKVDIERSELEIFGENCSMWLPAVRNICIELHGDDCREVFLRALRDFDYDPAVSGELTICRNLRPKTSPLQTPK
jgi:FkbM family methyltransferase